MRTFANADLQRMLLDDEPQFRMLALEFLSEGYAEHGQIMPDVFSMWDRCGVAEAYPEFPMLSHLAIAPALIDECCRRAAQMVVERKLTDPSTRCAGKLLEQVTAGQAVDLASHLNTIRETSKASKIFFRVDLPALQHRVDLLGSSADHLAVRLDSAIETLSRQPGDSAPFMDGLHALEALRWQHPDYLDMRAAIAQSPPESGPAAISFQLSMQSLIQFPQTGSEAHLAKHLLDQRETIFVNAVEALVRCGTPLAAAHLLAAFPDAQSQAQRWIARGLQRIRGLGLATEIAQLRQTTDDPALWLMLLVAEVRQFDPESIPRLTSELPRVKAFAGALLDALNVYVRLQTHAAGARGLQQAFMDYLQDANQDIQSKISSKVADSSR